MKIINFKSGLGNQIFYYLFYQYLKEKYPHESIYGCYNKKKLSKHNGLEVDKVFNVNLPPRTWFSDIISILCRKLTGIGIKGLKSTDGNYNESSVFFDGFYQDKKFYLGNVENIKFRDIDLSDENAKILKMIHQCDAISIHIRRGDYVEPKFIKVYGNICTENYYKKAIEIVLNKFPQARFFVFSNDMQWVEKNLSIPNCVYVTNNTGKNSFMDLYLMTQCKASIIANSSFSYWGARLNSNNPFVIYPKKWDNVNPNPDIFPDSWIKI